MNKQLQLKITYAILVAVVLGIGWWSLYVPSHPPASQQVLQVKYLDSEMREVGGLTQNFAVVNNVGNVSYIQFKVQVQNKGESELKAWLSDMQPAEIFSAYADNWEDKVSIAAGSEKVWLSQPVPVQLVLNTTQAYHVTVNMYYVEALKKSADFTRNGTVSLDVKPGAIIAVSSGNSTVVS